MFANCGTIIEIDNRIPDDHLSDQTKDVVKLSMGLVATIAALVLGLLVASTKDAFDQEKRDTSYGGAETAGTRALVRQIVDRMIAKLWPDSHSSLKSEALTAASNLAPTRWRLAEQGGSAMRHTLSYLTP